MNKNRIAVSITNLVFVLSFPIIYVSRAIITQNNPNIYEILLLSLVIFFSYKMIVKIPMFINCAKLSSVSNIMSFLGTLIFMIIFPALSFFLGMIVIIKAPFFISVPASLIIAHFNLYTLTSCHHDTNNKDSK